MKSNLHRTLAALSGTLAFAAAIVLIATSAHSEETSVFFTTGINSRYIALAGGGIVSPGAVAVNELDVGYKDWFAGVWDSTGLNRGRYGSTYADEVDGYIGWARKLGPVKLTLSTQYFALKSLNSSKDDLLVTSEEVDFVKCPFTTPYVWSMQFHKVGMASPKPGYFIWMGTRRAQPLGFTLGSDGSGKGIEQVLVLDASVAYTNGALRAVPEPGFAYARVALGLPVTLNHRMTLTPDIVLQTPIDGQQHHLHPYNDRDEVVCGVSLRVAI